MLWGFGGNMKSIIHNEKGCCFLCGKYGVTQEHHIFGGRNREMAEKYGLKIQLCLDCHTGKDGAHGGTDKAENLRKGLHISGQAVFESYYSQKKYKTKEPEWFYDREPREKFMQLFGINYL